VDVDRMLAAERRSLELDAALRDAGLLPVTVTEEYRAEPRANDQGDIDWVILEPDYRGQWRRSAWIGAVATLEQADAAIRYLQSKADGDALSDAVWLLQHGPRQQEQGK
jgi:hypothetical protein